jgi:Flp pilus assembly protein CpaB
MARIEGMTLARGNRGLLIIALLAGLIAAVLVFAALAQSDDGGSTTPGAVGATVPTVVAAQDIDAGTKITPEMIEVANWPENLKVTGAFDNTTPVVGEVTNYVIREGEAITPSKIGAPVDGNDQSLTRVVPPGMRAVGLRVEEVTAVGGNLFPGDWVDVIAVFPEDAGSPPHAVTVLQNVEILGVAQLTEDPRPAGNRDVDGDGVSDAVISGQLPEDPKQQPSAATITLSLSPAQVQLLALVQEEATKVYTSLRPFGEQDPVDVGAVDISAVRPQ